MSQVEGREPFNFVMFLRINHLTFIPVLSLSLHYTQFIVDMQSHYMYSPCEMTCWVSVIYEVLKPLESLSVEGLVRLWAHEALWLNESMPFTECLLEL